MLVIHILIQDRGFKLFFMKFLMWKAIAYRQRTEQSRNLKKQNTKFITTILIELT